MKQDPKLVLYRCPTCGDEVYCLPGAKVRCPVCRTWYDDGGEIERPRCVLWREKRGR
jgi:hypothetical protein